MKKALVIMVSLFLMACAGQTTAPQQKMEQKTQTSDRKSYNVIETRSVMNVKFSYTDIAKMNAEKEGNTLNSAIQSITPFLYIALTSAASNTNNFESYIIDRLHTDTKKGVDVAAVVIGGEYIDLAHPKKSQIEKITLFVNNLGKNPKIRISKAQKNGVAITM
jgi:hypothetical protein